MKAYPFLHFRKLKSFAIIDLRDWFIGFGWMAFDNYWQTHFDETTKKIVAGDSIKVKLIVVRICFLCLALRIEYAWEAYES